MTSVLPVSSAAKNGQPKHSLRKASAKAPLQLLGYSPESGIGGMIASLQSAISAAAPTQMVFTAHLASVLRTMALDGRGMAWLPHSLIAQDLSAGDLVEAATSEWQLELEVRLYRDKTVLSSAGEAFWQANVAHKAAQQA